MTFLENSGTCGAALALLDLLLKLLVILSLLLVPDGCGIMFLDGLGGFGCGLAHRTNGSVILLSKRL